MDVAIPYDNGVVKAETEKHGKNLNLAHETTDM